MVTNLIKKSIKKTTNKTTKKTVKKAAAPTLGYGEPNCAKCRLRDNVRVAGWGEEGARTMLVFPNPKHGETTNPAELNTK